MSISVQELPCTEGVLGVLTLNAPASLNALSEEMMGALQAQLDAWATDDRICLVLLHGAGERGFCAGGNIRQLYQAIQRGNARHAGLRYFSREYRLDYSLHVYPKPVICWGHGIIMGGGLGLMSASRYRLITPSASLAMPEIRIGLFPDVGAGWFLNRLPEGMGLFLGLTGARLNASDALRIGLADMAVPEDGLDTLLGLLQDTRWTGQIAADDNRLFRLLNRFEQDHPVTLPTSELASTEQTITGLCSLGSLPEIVAQLLSHNAPGDWWQSAQDNLRSGCPTTAWLVYEQLRRARQMSLKEIFTMELAMAVRCCEQPDLAEGIRTRLIDREDSPRWLHASVDEVPWAHVEQHFEAPWGEGPSPFDDL